MQKETFDRSSNQMCLNKVWHYEMLKNKIRIKNLIFKKYLTKKFWRDMGNTNRIKMGDFKFHNYEFDNLMKRIKLWV